MLNRLDSAVPDGTRVVIISTGADNDPPVSNVAHVIVERLRARNGIVILAPPCDMAAEPKWYNLLRRRAGYSSSGHGVHLSAEGSPARLVPCVELKPACSFGNIDIAKLCNFVANKRRPVSVRLGKSANAIEVFQYAQRFPQ